MEKFSLLILAYNHENFISKILDGVLKQKVNFKYTIYVNDDASSDKTVEIIKRYIEKYPDKIILLENKVNNGQFNAVNLFLNQVNSEYLSICDGDDYWSNEDKLQTQIDFLDENKDYIASCHDAKIVSEIEETNTGISKLQTKKHYKSISQFTTYRGNEIENWELLLGITYIQNCTLIWRKFDITPYKHLFSTVKFNLDWIFNLVLSMEGRIQFINEQWAVYVDHSNGRTKSNYFYNYYFDKIITLHQLKEIPFFKPTWNRRHIYSLLAKQYNDLLEGVSGGQKTKKQVKLFRRKYMYYSFLSVWEHAKYFKEKREDMQIR